MGLKTWFNNQNDRYKQTREGTAGNYGVHAVWSGVYRYLPSGRVKGIKKPVKGAVAEFDSGAANQSATAMRVVAGAVIAGPVGAVVGGFLKKDKTKCYVTVTFADGDVAIVEGPAKDERKLRDFAVMVNKAARA